MVNIASISSYSFKITYQTAQGEKKTLWMNGQDTIFTERSSLEQIFFTATKKLLQVQTVEVKDQKTQQVIWKVIPSALGMPNAGDRLIWRTLEKRIKDRHQDLSQNPCFVFEFKEILTELKSQGSLWNHVGGSQTQRIKDAIRRIAGQVIEVGGPYGSCEIEGISGRYIQDYGFIHELRPGSLEKQDRNFVLLGSFYCQSLRHNPPRCLNYGYLKALESPIAAALYERLSGSFWYSKPYRIQYSQLSFFLGIKEQNNPQFSRGENRRRGRLYLKEAHQELIDKQFVEHLDYENINTDPAHPYDFWITYHPGPVGQKEKILTLEQPDKTGLDERVKRFHVKKNQVKPEEASCQSSERTYLNTLLKEWQDEEKLDLFIEFAIQEMKQRFPHKVTQHIRAIEQVRSLFESQGYRKMLIQKVRDKAAGAQCVIFPEGSEVGICYQTEGGLRLEDDRTLAFSDLLDCNFR